MSGFDNEVLYAENVDFSGNSTVSATMVSDGQLLIGSDATPNIRVGNLVSSDGSLFVSNGPGSIDITVSSGSLVTQTLTPDVGAFVAPSAGTIPVLGQKANTTPVVTTYNDAPNFRIENRAWGTQYVVDPSTTVGLKGTFTTIQSAINQAVADGASATSFKTILIRKGTYNESLVMPANSIHLMGLTENGYPTATGSTFFDACINGQITFTAGAVAVFSNILITNTGSPPVLIGNAINECNFNNCYIIGSGANSITGTASVSQGIQINNCSIVGDISLTSMGSGTIFSSSINSAIALTSSTLSVIQCYLIGASAYSTTTAGALTIINCTTSGAVKTITANASTTVYAYGLYHDSTSVALTLAGAGTLQYGNIIGKYSITTTNQVVMPSTAYNSVPVTTPGAYPYTTLATDALILVDTSSARTITPYASPALGQKHIIKDNVGSAAANNITITPSGKNIDGAASSTINVAYGSATIIYNGTQWVIV